MFITRRDLNENRDPTGIKFPAGNINARNKGSAEQRRFHAAMDRLKQVAEGPKDQRS